MGSLESMVGRVEIGELGDEDRKGKRGKEVEKLGEKEGGGEKKEHRGSREGSKERTLGS